MGEGNGIPEEDRAAVIVVVAVIAFDDLVTQVRNVFSEIEAQSGTNRRNVAHKKLLQIELGDRLVLRLGDLGN